MCLNFYVHSVEREADLSVDASVPTTYEALKAVLAEADPMATV